jgi:hypothetical protein
MEFGQVEWFERGPLTPTPLPVGVRGRGEGRKWLSQ